MKAFAPLLPNLNIPLAVACLKKVGDGPWRLVSGGQPRTFTAKTLEQLGEWVKGCQEAGRAVFFMPPALEDGSWFVVGRLPLTSSPAECPVPPQFTIAADDFTLLWRVVEPLTAERALAIGEQLVKAAGGRAVAGEPVPLPGTVLAREVGPRLTQRYPVYMLPPLAAPAYRVVGNSLIGQEGAQDTSQDSDFARADEIKVAPMSFLWPGMIPAANFTLIAGEPKVGKSSVAVDLAARLSKGAAWPDGAAGGKPGNSLIIECEDDLATTQARLRAAGADMRRIVVSNVSRDLSTQEGLAVLERQREKLGGLQMLILSPVRLFLGETESTRQVEVRRRLDTLLGWAARHSVAVVGIAHKESGKLGRSAEDIAGPKAIAQRARAALVAMFDPADPLTKTNPRAARRILTSAGSNVGADDFELPYRIEGDGAGSRVCWLQETPRRPEP